MNDPMDTCNGIGLDVLHLYQQDVDIQARLSEEEKTKLDGLIAQLEEVDKATPDGCVTRDDVVKGYPDNKYPDIIMSGFHYRANDLKAVVQGNSSSKNVTKVDDHSEVHSQEIPTMTMERKFELIDNLFSLISEGYLDKDMEYSRSACNSFIDIATGARKLIGFWQDDNSFSGIREEWAEGRNVVRKAAHQKLLELLKQGHSVSDAMENIRQNKLTATIENDYDEHCLFGWCDSDGVISALGQVNPFNNYSVREYFDMSTSRRITIKGYDGELYAEYLDEYPTELIQRILEFEGDNIESQAQVFLEMGQWLRKKNNWVGTQVIFEELNNARKVIGNNIADVAYDQIVDMHGKPEERSPFMELILPPMPWNWKYFSDREKYNFSDRWVGFAAWMVSGTQAAKYVGNTFKLLGNSGKIITGAGQAASRSELVVVDVIATGGRGAFKTTAKVALANSGVNLAEGVTVSALGDGAASATAAGAKGVAVRVVEKLPAWATQGSGNVVRVTMHEQKFARLVAEYISSNPRATLKAATEWATNRVGASAASYGVTLFPEAAVGSLPKFFGMVANAGSKIAARAPGLGKAGYYFGRGLNGIGASAHYAWEYTGGAVGRGFKNYVAPIGYGAGKGFVGWLGEGGMVRQGILAGLRGGNWVVKETFGPIKLNWRGGVVAWWGAMAVGDPFIEGVNPIDKGIPYVQEFVQEEYLSTYIMDTKAYEVIKDIRKLSR